MPECVVDELEVVQVQHEHGEPAALTLYTLQCVLRAVMKQAAVGQARQRVVESLVTQAPLQLAPLRYIAHGQDDTCDVEILEKVLDDDLEGYPLAVGVRQRPVRDQPGPAAPSRQAGDLPASPLNVHGSQQGED